MRKSLKKFLVLLLSVPLGLLQRFTSPLIRLWRLASANSRIEIGSSCVLEGKLHLLGSENIKIGEEGYFYRDIHLETQEDGQIEIEDDVVISSGVHLVSFYKISLGKGVMIGEYSSIRDANHNPGSQIRHSGHNGAPITIENNAWVGRGCCILPGVTIGANSIIGANSVVTRSVPANSVAVGSPAKVIKTTPSND